MPDDTRAIPDSLISLFSDVDKLIRNFEGFRCEYRYAPNASLFLGELDVLQKTLQQHAQVLGLTGREPPRLRAVEEVLRQGQLWLGRQSAPLTATLGRRSDDPPPPPGGGSQNTRLGNTSALLNECTLMLKTLNATTTLSFAFAADFDPTGVSFRTGSRPVSPAVLQDAEIASLFAQVSLLRQLHRLNSAPETAQRRPSDYAPVGASTSPMAEALGRLFSRFGISGRSLTDLPMDGLISLVAEDHSKCIDSLKHSGQRPSKVSTEHLRLTGRDTVTIRLDENHSIEASEFVMFPSRCCWLDHHGSVVFEQRFLTTPDKRFPWRHAHSHDRLTFSFIKHEKGDFELVDYRATHNMQQETVTYTFKQEIPFNSFQSSLRGKRFLGDAETRFIHIKIGRQPTEQSCVKFWASEDSLQDRSMTIPVTTSETDMQHEEVPLHWVDCEKSQRLVTLTIQRARHDSAAESSNSSTKPKPFSRRLSDKLLLPLNMRRRSSPAKSPSPPLSLSIPPFTSEFFPIRISFTDNKARDKFANFFSIPLDVPLPPEVDRYLRSPPLVSPPPPLWEIEKTDKAVSELPSPGDPLVISPFDTNFQIPINPFTHHRTPSIPIPQPLPGALVHEIWHREDIQRTNRSSSTGPRTKFYHPVQGNQIRLLRLNPRDRSSMVVCTLRTCDLADTPPYEALSYCWGVGDKHREIMLGDRDYRVSKHLWEALDRLRLPDKHRYVWVDALCIDQENIPEKNNQILLMREIYRTAYRTIIWLGNYDMSDSTCPRHLVYPDEDGPPCLCTGPGLDAHEHQGMDLILEKILSAQQEDVEKHGLANVWWKRLWVVQEFFYSSRLPIVYIGPHAISWAHFEMLFPEENSPLSLFSPFHRSRNHTLFELLHMTGSFHCSNVRDRVYSLLGMAAEASRYIQPDYRRSILRVMEQACAFLIKESNTLDVLVDSRVDRSTWGPHHLTGMPTWVPDLTALQPLRSIPGEDGYNVGPDAPQAELVEYLPHHKPARHSIQPLDILQNLSPAPEDLSYDLPRPLKLRALYFDRIAARVSPSDLPADYEHSPGGYLVYNSLNQRGTVLDLLLDKLGYVYGEPPTSPLLLPHSPSPVPHFEARPSIGFLLLDYLFEGKRKVLAEFKERRHRPDHDSAVAYRKQQARDIEACRLADREGDAEYARARWQRKIDRAERDEVYEPQRLREAFRGRDGEVVYSDFLIAREFENLYVYARRTRGRYYFSGRGFDAPMRMDVLGARDVREAQALGTDYPAEHPLEFHEYSRKHRERDLFRTEGGCLGLGPSSMEVGDIVVMPFGSSRPFILRRVDASEAETMLGGMPSRRKMRGLGLGIDGPGDEGELSDEDWDGGENSRKKPTLYRLIGDAVVANYMTKKWYWENNDKEGQEYWLV